MPSANSKLEFHPLTPERWRDFESLFGERGACGGCWCMWPRLARSQYETQKGARNKRAMKKLVDGGRAPGIIAYQAGQPIGWCSVAPREEFLRLDRSRILKPVDEQPVWSVVCFFVAKEHRGGGLSAKLLRPRLTLCVSEAGESSRAIQSRRKRSSQMRSCGQAWRRPLPEPGSKNARAARRRGQ